MMKPNPDNRADNVSRIQHNIDMTIENIHRADKMIGETSDQNMKQVLSDKNERRMDALDSLRQEIKDEAKATKNSGLQ